MARVNFKSLEWESSPFFCTISKPGREQGDPPLPALSCTVGWFFFMPEGGVNSTPLPSCGIGMLMVHTLLLLHITAELGIHIKKKDQLYCLRLQAVLSSSCAQ